ncbi:ADP-ribosylglycohydrolase [alpha proteobacterium HIMB114]|nr:ADP-ribosylglycohydrolase [alpha proteobacterium HIMB114]
MLKKLHIFLGATVGDAAARPLHWVYNEKKLKSYLKNKKEVAFLKNNKCPFYSINTGEVSGYSDVGQVMFKTLIENNNKKILVDNFKKNIIKNFGQGSNYWKNLKFRKKYKKIKWKKPIQGPWIHQNILETIQNIKLKKKITGGKKVNESDGFCATLPYYLQNQSIAINKLIIKTISNNKLSVKFALAKLEIINFADKKYKNPVNFFLKKYKNNNYFKEVVENIKKVKQDKNKPHTFVVKKFGKACSYPGTFNGSIHAIITSNSFKSAINKTIKAGGCNCSRANFVGAYFSALKGLQNIPKKWILKTKPAKEILRNISKYQSIC